MIPNPKSVASHSAGIPAFDLSRIALLLDVDGTLLDLAARPDEVQVPDDLRDVLKALAECAHCVLALVSGRATAQLDMLFSPVKLASSAATARRFAAIPPHPFNPAPRSTRKFAANSMRSRQSFPARSSKTK